MDSSSRREENKEKAGARAGANKEGEKMRELGQEFKEGRETRRRQEQDQGANKEGEKREYLDNSSRRREETRRAGAKEEECSERAWAIV